MIEKFTGSLARVLCQRNQEFLKVSRNRNGRDADCTMELQMLMRMGTIQRTTGVSPVSGARRNREFLKDSRNRNGRDAHCTVELQLLMRMGKITLLL